MQPSVYMKKDNDDNHPLRLFWIAFRIPVDVEELHCMSLQY